MNSTVKLNHSIDQLYTTFSTANIESVRCTYFPFGRKFKVMGKTHALTSIVDDLYKSVNEALKENDLTLRNQHLFKAEEIAKNLIKLDQSNNQIPGNQTYNRLFQKICKLVIDIFPYKKRRKCKLDQIIQLTLKKHAEEPTKNLLNLDQTSHATRLCSSQKTLCEKNQEQIPFFKLNQDSFDLMASYLISKELSLLARVAKLEQNYVGFYQKNRLDASYRHLNDEHAKKIAQFLPNLTTLDLFQCEKLTDEGLKSMSSLQCLKSLNLSHSLKLYNAGRYKKISHVGLSFLTSIEGLQALYLDNHRHLELKAVHCFKHLEILSLNGCWSVDIDLLKSLSTTKLRKLNLNGCFLTGAWLTQINTFSELTDLDIGNSMKESERSTSYDLKKIQSNLKLQSLNLEDHTLTLEDLMVIASFTNLTALNLRACGLSPSDLDTLMPLEKLENLNLSNNPLLEKSHLEILRTFSNLKTLCLDYSISSLSLSEIGKLEKLEHLSLNHPILIDNDLEKLSNLIRLKCLNLYNCRLEGSGFKHLASLPLLEELDLRASVTQVTDH